MTQSSSRRDFIKQIGAGAAAIGAGLPATTTANAAPHTFATGRVLGANDRINVGFVGCGGRMNSHIRHIIARSKDKGDVMPVAVNDIWDKRKKAAQEATGVDAKSVYHD
jgi:anaerobic selenocysteine-containing dehydrogenase